MTDKKELAIVFGSTGNMAFALGNVLIGLKKYSLEIAKTADIKIFEQGISGKDKKILNSILPCEFIEYKFPHQGYLTDETVKKFSELTFSRFECFDMLNEYKKVLWLDIDILIQKPFDELLNEVSTGISLASGDENASDFSIKIDGISHYNAGIMYLQDNLPNYTKFTKWCYDKTVEMAQYLKCADQGIINLMVKEHNLNVHGLHCKYNYNPVYGVGSNIVIYHSFCPEKFWNYWNFKEWNENNKIWLKMGGTSYKGKKYSYWERKFKDVPHPLKRTRNFLKYVFSR